MSSVFVEVEMNCYKGDNRSDGKISIENASQLIFPSLDMKHNGIPLPRGDYLITAKSLFNLKNRMNFDSTVMLWGMEPKLYQSDFIVP